MSDRTIVASDVLMAFSLFSAMAYSAHLAWQAKANHIGNDVAANRSVLAHGVAGILAAALPLASESAKQGALSSHYGAIFMAFIVSALVFYSFVNSFRHTTSDHALEITGRIKGMQESVDKLATEVVTLKERIEGGLEVKVNGVPHPASLAAETQDQR